MNPNKDMGFSKFELRPHPDFVVQCLGDHYEEQMTMGVDGVGDLTNPGPAGTFAGGVIAEVINAVGYQG